MNVRCWTIPFLAVLALSSGAIASPSPGISVDGRVVDPEGHALAGVRVEIRPAASLYEEGAREAEGTGEPPPAAAAVSGRDGRFTLTAPQAGMWTVTVHASGRVAVRTALSPLLEPVALPDAVLLRDVGLLVRVEDADGKLVPGARVQAAARQAVEPAMSATSAVASPWGPLPRRSRTSANGEARLARAAEESLQVWAVADGYAVTEASASMDAVVTLRLHRETPRRIAVRESLGTPPAGVIFRDVRSGFVLGRLLPGRKETDLTAGASTTILVETADGRRMSLPATAVTDVQLDYGLLRRGAVVALAPEHRLLAGAWIWPPAEPGLAVQSDAHGAYQLQASLLAHGIQAAAPGFLPVSRQRVSNVDRDISFLGLSPASSIAGTVVDEAGRPVAGALVTVGPLRTGRYDPRLEVARVWTSSTGAFRIGGLGLGPVCRVEVRHPDFAPLAGTLDGLPGEKKDLRIVLRRGAAVTGTLVNERGRPPAGPLEVELVRAPPDDDDVLRRAAVRRDGRFVLDHLPAGLAVLHVRRAGAMQFHRPGVRTPATGTADLGRLPLPGGETVTVRVNDPGGRPLAGAEVLVFASEPDTVAIGHFDVEYGQSRVTTGENGEAVLHGLAPGQEILVDVCREGSMPGTWAGIVPREPVRVTLGAAVFLSGTVVDADGAPVAGANVIARRNGLPLQLDDPIEPVGGGPCSPGDERYDLATDREGRFTIAPLVPGSYQITASGDGFIASTIPAVEVPEGGRAGLTVPLQHGTPLSYVGRVTDAQGAPVNMIEVSALGGPKDFTDAGGWYDLQGFANYPQTTATIYVQTEGRGFKKAEKGVPVWPDVTTYVNFALTPLVAPPPTARGWVVEPDGAPPAGSAIRGTIRGLKPEELAWTQIVATLGAPERGVIEGFVAADGSYHIGPLPPEEWTLTAWIGNRQAQRKITVHEGGKDITLDVTLPAEGTQP